MVAAARRPEQSPGLTALKAKHGDALHLVTLDVTDGASLKVRALGLGSPSGEGKSVVLRLHMGRRMVSGLVAQPPAVAGPLTRTVTCQRNACTLLRKGSVKAQGQPRSDCPHPRLQSTFSCSSWGLQRRDAADQTPLALRSCRRRRRRQHVSIPEASISSSSSPASSIRSTRAPARRALP